MDVFANSLKPLCCLGLVKFSIQYGSITLNSMESWYRQLKIKLYGIFQVLKALSHSVWGFHVLIEMACPFSQQWLIPLVYQTLQPPDGYPISNCLVWSINTYPLSYTKHQTDYPEDYMLQKTQTTQIWRRIVTNMDPLSKMDS